MSKCRPGRRSEPRRSLPEDPESTLIKHHWVRTATCYDYPIAGTGHLADGFTVADQFEICISQRRNAVASITPKSKPHL